ncbi:MAG: ABC transporter permease [Planctomycetes bacterium]|nr:ABC transporter permease [Planctomycetota bacterium]
MGDLRPAIGAQQNSPLFLNSMYTGYMFLTLIAPAITMNSFALERSQGTMQLLQTVPIKEWQLVGGKFLASWIMLSSLVLATLVQPICLYFISEVHVYPLMAGYLGYIGLCLLFSSIGIWISLLVDSPIAAYVLTFGCIMLLHLFGLYSNGEEGILNSIGSFIGLGPRMNTFLSGDLQLGGILYFVGLSLVLLTLCHGALRARRIHG